uniref:type II toxin-antitoxin system TacA family antitoxin n=1 Tax=Photorhabdus sp. RM322S TaxID=3342825 RepID=UPI0036DD9DF4
MGIVTERINLRLQHQVKQSIERAASLEGKTVSSFILACALAQAERTIHEHEVMRLNNQDSEAFFNALANPVDFNDKLTAALSEHSQRVTHK